MVPIGLLGIGQGELADRLVERGAVAAIARDHCRVARLGMGQRQRPAAQAAIFRESFETLVAALVELDAALHVGELPHVEMTVIADFPPAQEDVGRPLGQALADDDTAPVVLEAKLVVDIGFQHRGLRLLDLQEQGIVAVDALQQHNPASRPHTADTHDFAGRIDDAIARQQEPPVDRQRIDVGTQHGVERDIDRHALLGMGLAHDQRQFLDDAMLTVDLLGEFFEDGDVPLGPCLVHHLHGGALPLGRQRVEHGAFVDAVVPDLEVSHLGIAPHPLAVGPYDRLRRRLGFLLVAAHEAGRHGGARRQAFQIPFPWTGMHFVEIIDGEDQVALG